MKKLIRRGACAAVALAIALGVGAYAASGSPQQAIASPAPRASVPAESSC